MTLHTAPRRHPLLSLEVDTPSWDGAECRSYDPELWFTDDHANIRAQANTILAQTICNEDCPIVAQCREWALAHPELTQFGVFGGLTAEQRHGQARFCQMCDQQLPKGSRANYCDQCRHSARQRRASRHYQKKVKR